MSVPRAHDGSCDLTVQPTVSTLHIPASHAFIPFQQFSLSDATGLRNPADDNNNKTVVSVVAAVSGLCPAIPVVSMQQQAQLAQAVVTPTIIPTVVAPMAVQTANGLTPTTTMTMTNTLNISSHLSVPTPLPQQQQQQAINNTPINLTPQTSGINGNKLINSHNTASNNNISSIGGSTPTNPTSSNKSNSSSNNSSNSNSPSSSGNGSSSGSSSKSSSSNPSKPSSSQNSSSEQTDDLVKPVFKDGELVLEVECGQNKAILYLSKLCQGSKGPCISFQSSWLTPNEFQFVSGRETAKDWKRSIRHHGKSLKLLLAKGILNVHPTMCDCDGCRQGATLTRKGEKRRIPNGERKPRKPSSNTGNGGHDGNVAGAFRPVPTSTMAAHLASPGGAQPKPEAKRSASDKPKIADVTPQSPLKETSVNLPKQIVAVKPAPSQQRPDVLATARDAGKEKASSSSSSASAISSVLLQTPSAPAHATAAASTSLPQNVNSTSASIIPSRVPTFPTTTTSPNLLTPMRPNTESSTVAISQLNASTAPASAASSATTTAVVTSEEHQAHPGSSVSASCDLSQTSNPDNHSSPQKQRSNSPTACETDHVSAASEDEDHDITNEDASGDEESINVDNDHESHHYSDGNSENTEEESDEEQEMDHVEMASENKDAPASETHDKVDGPMKPIPSDINGTEKDSVDCSDNKSTEEEEMSVEKAKDKKPETPSEKAPSSDLYAKCSVAANPVATTDAIKVPSSGLPQGLSTSATTLTVSAVSGACTQPLSVSISTNNVKSENIWVPPTLSPASNIQHNHSSNSSGLAVPKPLHSENNVKSQASPVKTSSKDYEKHNVPSQPPPGSTPENIVKSEDRNVGHVVKSEAAAPAVKSQKPFHSIERHLSHLDHSKEKEAVKRESDEQISTSHKPPTALPVSNNDKKYSDREREERHRQKMREERNRKDREREERFRKEKEREAERETERKRQEEKEKLMKAQAEGSKERSSTTPGALVMDPNRRPPGGVTEAAAFSDYMRVLAAGHGHTFMPPNPNYMPSLFPIRPQETPLPSHLLHQMSAYGPQFSGIPKDPMLYQTTAGPIPNYGAPSFGPLHPLLQRPQYSAQQSLLEYQRSLAAASYQWPSAYPYLLHDMAATSSSSSSSSSAAAAAAAAAAAGMKRHSSEIEAAMEFNAKRMRLEGRPPEYTSPWDYFAAAAAASQQQRVSLAPNLPCGLESANVDKNIELLRKRYMEYGPQAAAYLSALPEYARPMYHCACADHRDEDIRMWSVEDVCKFLNSLDGCAVYSDHFREQRVDGRILALLTTDHLVKTLGMKLGPAVLLSEAVAKKLQDISKMANCDACRSIAMSQSVHPMALPL